MVPRVIDVAAPALRLLDAVVAHFAANGWDLPERRYVAHGAQHSMAVDDAHLLVSLVQVVPGPADNTERAGGLPGSGIGAIAMPRATLMLRLMRCVTTVDAKGRAPAAAKLHEDGLRLLADPGRMLSAIEAWLAAERLQKTATWGEIEPQGPEGGISGHLAVVTISPIQ